jgi:UDP-N-acetylmuramate dehydrogenase
VAAETFGKLKADHSGMVGFPLTDGKVKLAAGWMIEQCGWKGFRRGDAGCHIHQALVLVNYGNASGAEIYSLSEEIIQSVVKKYGVVLEREVNII